MPRKPKTTVRRSSRNTIAFKTKGKNTSYLKNMGGKSIIQGWDDKAGKPVAKPFKPRRR